MDLNPSLLFLFFLSWAVTATEKPTGAPNCHGVFFYFFFFPFEQEEAQQQVLTDLERDEWTTMHKNIYSMLDTKAVPPGEDYVAETRRRVEGGFFFPLS